MYNKEKEIKESILSSTKRWIKEDSIPKSDFHMHIASKKIIEEDIN